MVHAKGRTRLASGLGNSSHRTGPPPVLPQTQERNSTLVRRHPPAQIEKQEPPCSGVSPGKGSNALAVCAIRLVAPGSVPVSACLGLPASGRHPRRAAIHADQTRPTRTPYRDLRRVKFACWLNTHARGNLAQFDPVCSQLKWENNSGLHQPLFRRPSSGCHKFSCTLSVHNSSKDRYEDVRAVPRPWSTH